MKAERPASSAKQLAWQLAAVPPATGSVWCSVAPDLQFPPTTDFEPSSFSQRRVARSDGDPATDLSVPIRSPCIRLG
jgi:hypothetical protein